jgi:LacI family transcriptional regulator
MSAGETGQRRRRTGTGIRQVAQEAGVSVTTVSNVLNNVEGSRITEQTRDRVLSAADRLGYVPNRLARGLRRQKSGTLGLISDKIATTPHAGQMILGAQEMAVRHGLTLVLFNTDLDPVVEERDIRTLLQFQVDGVVYATMYHRVVTLPGVLAGVPTVVLDSEVTDPTVPSVVPDEVAGGRAAVQELLQAGHRRIGFCTNVDDVPATHGRLHAYRECLAEAGIAFDETLVLADVSEGDGGYRTARALLGREVRPTALFCYNDRMAMGAYRAAAELGLRIPTDVSIVGFDNQELIAENLYPALTTVALPHYEMGAWAVEQLIALVDRDQDAAPDAAPDAVQPLRMTCPLVRRDSVAPPPGADQPARRKA